MPRLQQIAVPLINRPFDGVLQFADIARPLVFQHQLQRVRCDTDTAETGLVAVHLGKLFRQQRNVGLALA